MLLTLYVKDPPQISSQFARKLFWYLGTVAQRLPISLLELNTSGHAICALLIYFLWWHKPFEVDDPTIVKSELLDNLCAAAWMRKELSPAAKNFQAEYRERLQHNKAFHPLTRVGSISFASYFSFLKSSSGPTSSGPTVKYSRSLSLYLWKLCYFLHTFLFDRRRVCPLCY